MLAFVRPTALMLSGERSSVRNLTTAQQLARERAHASELAAARDSGLKLAAGLGALAAALLAWGRLELSRDERGVARAGQDAARYGAAIDQLGTDHADVQVGGLFALEAIARSAPDYRDAVGQVVGAFVRRRSTLASSESDTPTHEMDQATSTALSILGRNRWEEPIDLRSCAFPRAKLADANLSGLVLNSCDLSGATLDGASLDGAELRGADLSGASCVGSSLIGAVLAGAALRGSQFSGAGLAGADLSGADLSGAVLVGADLSGTDLRRADLTGARLDRANVTGADLTGANLTNAVFRDVTSDDRTSWPGSGLQKSLEGTPT